MNIVTRTLEKTELEFPEDKFYSHTNLPSSPPTSPPYLNPYSTPTHIKTRFESYRTRDKLSSFKLSNMLDTTVQPDPSTSDVPSTPVRQEPLSLNVPITPGFLHTRSPLTPLNDPSQVMDDDEISFADSSFAIELDSSNQVPTSYPFKGPLIAAPLENVLVVPGKPLKNFKVAKRWREVKLDPELSLRREIILSIGEVYLDRTNVPSARVLHRHAYGFFKDELALLESALLGHPGRVSARSSIGYYLDPWKYKRLQSALSRLLVERQNEFQQLRLPTPPLPTLPSQWSSDSLWSSGELEVVCVTLREDVENFLAYCWDVVAKFNGSWRPPKDDFASPAFLDISETSMDPELVKIRLYASQSSIQRKMAADRRFDEAKAPVVRESPAPEPVAPSHTTRPVSHAQNPAVSMSTRETSSVPRTSFEIASEFDPEQIRREQSTVYGRGPRPSLFNSPYRQDPSKLTGSTVMDDMFYTPPSIQRTISTNQPDPSRVSNRTHGASGGGAPPPGGEPPDDDDSSGPPHAPRPSLPRPSLPHNNDGSGHPGGSGGGPPDGGDDGGGGGYEHLPDWGDSPNQGSHNSNAPATQNKLEPYFDTKLRPELVPE